MPYAGPSSIVDGDAPQSRAKLDAAPPSPPRNSKNLVAMSVGDQDQGNQGLDMSNPAIELLKDMGDAKNALIKIQNKMPTAAQGIQSFITGLEQVVAQQASDIVSGNPPGSSGSSLGGGDAATAAAPPTPPPVQAGMA